jgi:phosphoribosylpyrophosphate synthetase
MEHPPEDKLEHGGIAEVMNEYFPSKILQNDTFMIHFLYEYFPISGGEKNDHTYTILNFKQGCVSDKVFGNLKGKLEARLTSLNNHLDDFFHALPDNVLVAFVPSSTKGKPSPFAAIRNESNQVVNLTRHTTVLKATEGERVIHYTLLIHQFIRSPNACPSDNEFVQINKIDYCLFFEGGARDVEVHKATIVVSPLTDDMLQRPVVLLDDVTTSGSSLDACRQLLYDAGAIEVHCAVIGKTS